MFTKKAITATVVALAAMMNLGIQQADAAMLGGRTVDRVAAHTSDTYTIHLNRGEIVMVTVKGDGDTDLDLYVRDRFGDIVESDTDSTDQCVAIFRAPRTGTFEIQIKNLGRVYNEYELTVVN